MASVKIADRTNSLDGPWSKTKSANVVLTKGLFKPPMDPLVVKYDKDMDDYDDLMKKKLALKDVLSNLMQVLVGGNDMSEKLSAEVDKINADDRTQMDKIMAQLTKCKADPDPDPKDVMSVLTGMQDNYDRVSKARRAAMDAIDAKNNGIANQIKKLAADYKTRSDAITNGISKLETDMNSVDDQIRKLAQVYTQIAMKMNNTDVPDALRDFVGLLSK